MVRLGLPEAITMKKFVSGIKFDSSGGADTRVGRAAKFPWGGINKNSKAGDP